MVKKKVVRKKKCRHCLGQGVVIGNSDVAADCEFCDGKGWYK